MRNGKKAWACHVSPVEQAIAPSTDNPNQDAAGKWVKSMGELEEPSTTRWTSVISIATPPLHKTWPKTWVENTFLFATTKCIYYLNPISLASLFELISFNDGLFFVSKFCCLANWKPWPFRRRKWN